MQFENQKKSKFSNPEKRTFTSFFGILENPEKRTFTPDPDIMGIPKNAHLRRFSGFPKKSRKTHIYPSPVT